MSSPYKFMTRLLQLATCTLLLTSCGFQPMYGTAGTQSQITAEQGLDQVDIALIPDAEGVYLRNALIDRFYQNGYPAQPRFRLTVDKIVQSESDFDVTIESEATRRQLTLFATVQLTDVTKTEPLFKRELRTVTSYDVIGSQFTTRVAEEDARKAALSDLARQIETQVSLFLSR
jgi:LPS-assembly lipoprotein